MEKKLIIGLGGTGSRVVNFVAKMLRDEGRKVNDGEIYCAVLDTNKNDNTKIRESGVGVPVFPTSKPQRLSEYMKEYSHLHMEEWCPVSPIFLEEGLTNGASEVRLKSRIGFMDCSRTTILEDLGKLLNEVMDNADGTTIRVMLVSSLSGGTGSGMFIQVALWLRNHFGSRENSIRGLFLLPDIFTNTIEDIRNSKATQVRHYCNAYAAIRELNTISKIKKHGDLALPEKLVLDNLFDSETDANKGVSVFDYAYFMDFTDENGVFLNSITEYEELAAQLTYSHMCSPMASTIYSEEDNTFAQFSQIHEPLYCSGGASKAVYPTKVVKEYCILRAGQDALSGNWKNIDAEIAAKKAKIEYEESIGKFSSEVFDFQTEYIKLFERKASVSLEEAGRDRFFIEMGRETKNESRIKGPDGKLRRDTTDRIEDFLFEISKIKIDTAINGMNWEDDYAFQIPQNAKSITEKQILDRSKKDVTSLSTALDDFDSTVTEKAEELADEIFPLSMGDININTKTTVYSLFAKEDGDGNLKFIHPVAARYMIYKLLRDLREQLDTISYKSKRDAAIQLSDPETFDNKATPATEATLEEFIKSKPFLTKMSAHLLEAIKKHKLFVDTKIALCKDYATEKLTEELYKLLIKRTKSLIVQIDNFFDSLDAVNKKFNSSLERNLETKTKNDIKVVYIYSSPEHREYAYSQLRLNLHKNSDSLNKTLIESLYGCFCATERPEDSHNEDYVGIDIAASFLVDLTKDIRRRIENDPYNSGQINLDFYTALCRESDANTFIKKKASKKVSSIDDVDISTGEIVVQDDTAERYKEAFKKCYKSLLQKAAPFLEHEKEPAGNALGVITMREKTYWGFHTDVITSCPQIGDYLGINETDQASDDYLRNEFYCCRAVLGIEAKYIPKFNELKGGDYFTCYSSIVDDMVRDSAGAQGESAYARTPHLDKRWHKILPYVTPDKRNEEVLSFYHGLWLSFAYGTVYTDKDGKLFLKRSVDGGYEIYIDKTLPLVSSSGKHLTKTDVPEIIETLKTDEVFNTSDIPVLEEKFKAELKEIKTYVGTEVLQGLTPKKEDLNPITFVSRYYESQNHDIQVAAYLIGALEKIAQEMASHYNTDRSEALIDEAKFKICKRIFDSSSRIKGKEEIFKRWVDAFSKYKLSKTSDHTGSSETE